MLKINTSLTHLTNIYCVHYRMHKYANSTAVCSQQLGQHSCAKKDNKVPIIPKSWMLSNTYSTASILVTIVQNKLNCHAIRQSRLTMLCLVLFDENTAKLNLARFSHFHLPGTRNWWCDFYCRSTFGHVMRSKRSNSREIANLPS